MWAAKVCFDSAAELERRSGEIGPVSLSRQKGVRTNEALERWTVRSYLKSRLAAGNLGFPLSIEFGDRPDAVVVEAGRKAGLEVTVATFPGVEIALGLVDDQDTLVYSLDGIARHDPAVPINKASIASYLGDQQQQSAGYMGDSVENEILQLLDGLLRKKLNKLNKLGFTCHPFNDLLIYENTGMPPISWKRIDLSPLKAINSDWAGTRFDRITVLDSDELISLYP